MRILFRYLQPTQGGAMSSFVKMLEGYCARFPDDDLTVMCAWGSPLAQLSRHPNCRVEVVGRRMPREAYLVGLGDVANWYSDRRHRYDVFWAVNIGAYFPNRLPQVLMINNAYQVYPASAAKSQPGLRTAALRGLFRRSLRLSDAAIVQTPLMEKYTRQIPGCPEHVFVLPKAVVAPEDNGLSELPRRIAARLARSEPVPTLLYVATENPHKNHRILAAMMEEFRNRRRTIRLVVTLREGDWRTLGGLAAESLVESGHVLPIGWVDKEELASLYAACDACVMPSLLESLSSAHIEAMHWRKPQVAADLPYARELCGDAALYADPYDAAAWVAQVERVLASPGLRAELIRNGTQRAADFPASWADMAGRIRSVLTAAIAVNARRFQRSAAGPLETLSTWKGEGGFNRPPGKTS